MAWGEIKSTLNSTLGTKKFLPLNELVTNGFVYTSGEDVVGSFSFEPPAQSGVWVDVAKATFLMNGAVSLEAYQWGTSKVRCSCRLLKDGEMVTNVKKGEEYLLQVRTVSATDINRVIVQIKAYIQDLEAFVGEAIS